MLILLIGIAVLLIAILVLRLHAFIALLLSALAAGFMAGMAPDKILLSMESGIGSTLGGTAMVLALGLMLGSILTETGGAQAITERFLKWFGVKYARHALALASFVVGVAMFYNAGFVVLAPLVFSVARQTGQAIIPLAISMAAPLSVTHGFLPPHPGATTIANQLGADLGKTLFYGLIIGIPTVLLAGVWFPGLLKNLGSAAAQNQTKDSAYSSPFGLSVLVVLLPVCLPLLSLWATFSNNIPPDLLVWIKFIGQPGIAMLIAVLAALLLLAQLPGLTHRNAPSVPALMQSAGDGLSAAAGLLLIIAAGGAFKQILVDSKAGIAVAEALGTLPLSPLFIGWSIATLLRVSLGSATVAGITAAGIVQPMMAATGASPELMTIAIGAGSLMCSHLNDTGFWMFKEWFGLSLKQTFLSWTLMETIVGIAGLLGVLSVSSYQ
ncbi:MAG: gluconate permease [Chitinophagales bacterium]|nr:gluconate permease [Chitinophagales bacterium]